MSRQYQRECAIANTTRLERLNGSQLKGWAIFAGCEGEDPSFVVFTPDYAYAESLLAARDPEDANEALFFDATMVPAIVTADGIVASNDVTVETHEQLEQAISLSWVDDDTDQLVVGCIGGALDCGCRDCAASREMFRPDASGIPEHN